MELQLPVDSTVANNFKWRTRQHEMLFVGDMETSHLFHTLRMIWNNVMPDPVQDNPKFYTFGAFYTNEYMVKALYCLSKELFTRRLTDQQYQQLEWMRKYCEENQTVLEKQIGRIEF